MKENETKLIAELLENSKKSDRELGKTLGLSQATVSRTRTKLERDRVIQEYTIIPDFRKLGIELMAITFGTWSPAKIKEYSADERVEKAKNFLSKHPHVIFASSGQGLGKGRIVISLHKNYSEYSEFIEQARIEWAGLVDLETFIISLEGDVAPFSLSFRNLGKYVEKQVADSNPPKRKRRFSTLGVVGR
jgi:DNA-binding Lrp family transcriptional regulator